MASSESDLDQGFTPAPSIDLRCSSRSQCDRLLAIGEYDGAGVPKRFLPVRGKDISATGIAFYSDWPVLSAQVVILFEFDQGLMAVPARIVRHAREVQKRRARYVVGAEFAEPLDAAIELEYFRDSE